VGSIQLLVGPAFSLDSEAIKGPFRHVPHPKDPIETGKKFGRLAKLSGQTAIHGHLNQCIILSLGSITPNDRIRLGHFGNLINPKPAAWHAWLEQSSIYPLS